MAADAKDAYGAVRGSATSYIEVLVTSRGLVTLATEEPVEAARARPPTQARGSVEPIELSSPTRVPQDVLSDPEVRSLIEKYREALERRDVSALIDAEGDLGEAIAKKMFERGGLTYIKHERRTATVDGYVLEGGLYIPVEVKFSASKSFGQLIEEATHGKGGVRAEGGRGGCLEKYFRKHPEVPYGYAVAVRPTGDRGFAIVIRVVPNPYCRERTRAPSGGRWAQRGVGPAFSRSIRRRVVRRRFGPS